MYYPNLKTSDSELRAVRFLTGDVKRKIVPIFELTRSRKTKALPEGSLVRRIEQVNEIYGEDRFILDLCTQEELMNSETVDLFDENDGYSNWIEFLANNVGLNITPCALYIEDGDKNNFQRQCVSIVKIYGKICIRTSVLDENAEKLYRWARDVVSSDSIILCGILYYIEPGGLPKYEDYCRNYVRSVIGNTPPGSLLFPGSSFPRFVTDVPGNDDFSGTIHASEIELENRLKSVFANLNLESSDFASIHPIRYETRGGNWIPRVDVFDGNEFSYIRVRRDDGGYLSVGRAMGSASFSSLPDCWGKTQLADLSSGNVGGGSPSFWISVRANCFITSRATL